MNIAFILKPNDIGVIHDSVNHAYSEIPLISEIIVKPTPASGVSGTDRPFESDVLPMMQKRFCLWI